MSLLTDLSIRLRALFLRSAEERDMEEEFQDHLERDIEARVHAGSGSAEARRQATLALGGMDHAREQVRDARGTRWLDDLVGDLCYAARGLRRNPAFTLTALVVLSLGLAASAVVFGLGHAVVLADLPYPDANRLVRVFEQNAPNNRWSLSVADVTAIGEQQQVFESWGVLQRTAVALSGTGMPERVIVGRVTSGYVEAVGVTVARGRPIEPGDESVEAPPVAVLTHALAESRFGNAGAALDRTIMLDGIAHTVVGVWPAGRRTLGGVAADVWSVLKLQPPSRRGPFGLAGLGRLKPGATVEAAARDLARVSDNLLPLWPDFRDSTAKLTPVPLRSIVVGSSGRQIALFAGGVALVLLLAIVNVATLVLVRSTTREPELAVRIMLGAHRTRIARLLVTENLLLTLAAGAAGLGIAAAGLPFAVSQLANLPRVADATLDWRVLAVGFCMAALAGIVVSLSPVASLSGADALARHTGGVRAGMALRTRRLRSVFVVAQFALAWPLLVVAGLLSVSVVRLQRVDQGFDATGLVAVGATLPSARYLDADDVQGFWRRVEQRVGVLSGVRWVGLATQIPPDRSGGTDNFNLVSRPVPAGEAEPQSPWYYATRGYFATLGIDVVAGRLFSEADTAVAFPVVVVSRSWALRYFGRDDVVGEQLVQGGCYACPRTTIVGVVADVRNLGPSLPMEAVYAPAQPVAPRTMFVVARQAIRGARGTEAVREALRALDPELPLTVTTLADRLETSLDDPKRWAAVLMAFSVIGLTLASIGVFGLVSYTVRHRRREIGVRLALGADPAGVTRLIVARGLAHATAGSVIGVVVTVLVTLRLRDQLFGVSPTDPLTFAVVALVLIGSALIASWLPARSAARVRPVEAIASE